MEVIDIIPQGRPRGGRSLLFAAIFQKTFQKEGQEVGEGVELAVIANVLVPQFDTVSYIRIGVPINQGNYIQLDPNK